MEDWDDYRFFLAVAHEGSLSGAARSLKVSQPTVSRRISQLEQRLGVRLFDQLPTGMKLTPSGGHIVDSAEAVQEKTIELRRRISGRETDLAGEVVVTATQSFASYWLAGCLARFSTTHPEIVVSCLADNQTLSLSRREADVAIRFDRPKSSGLIGSRVGYIHCGIYGAASYFEANGEPTKLSDLKHHKLIDTVEPISRFPQSRELKELMCDAKVSCTTNCPHTYLALAAAGQGLICTTCYTAAHAPNLRRVLADQYDKRIELWMVVHPDLKGSARVRVLMQFLREQIRADHEILSGH